VGGNKDVVVLRANYSILKCLSLSSSVDTGPEIAFQATTNIATNPTYVANLYVILFRPDTVSGIINARVSIR
jgi:hypothetical protein